ncbi:MAG: hypothetical protein SGI72_08395 [Planctomycetota bacterium]|nr:hypothetical protein [Planctomycetota bacterium]
MARFGNPKMHGAGTAADRRLFRQHDATWIGAEEGGLARLVFNNGEGRLPLEYSTVDEVLMPFDAERGFGATATVEPRWSYSAPEKSNFYSSFISGAQRLSNGHTLVCSGVDGCIFEIQRDGTIVWEYRNPLGGDVAMGPPRGGGATGADRPQAEGTPPAPDARPDGTTRGGGRGGVDEKALFRATHIALDHPGLARLRVQPQ